MNKQEQQSLKDKILEAELELAHTLDPQPAWNKLEQRLRPKKKRIILVFYRAAALILVLFILFTALLPSRKPATNIAHSSKKPVTRPVPVRTQAALAVLPVTRPVMVKPRNVVSATTARTIVPVVKQDAPGITIPVKQEPAVNPGTAITPAAVAVNVKDNRILKRDLPETYLEDLTGESPTIVTIHHEPAVRIGIRIKAEPVADEQKTGKETVAFHTIHIPL